MKLALSFFALFCISAFAHAGDDELFNFRFALKGPGQSRAIYVQGETIAPTSITEVCGSSGTLCTCEAQNSEGVVLESTDSAHIAFDTEAKYLTCNFVNFFSQIAKVRVYHGRISSPVIDVKTSVEISDLVGSYLDVNRVRSIYRYVCQMNYLQKEGTTTQSFDCSRQLTSCDPTSDSSKNFCLLVAKMPFHLFADNYSSNFSLKPTDSLYNGGGDGKICGMQIKKMDCTAFDGEFPTKAFGLYGEQAGYWTTPVSLAPAPDQPNMNVGFAAKVNSVTNLCPPGLVKRIFSNVSVVTTDIFPSHNFPSGQVVTEVRDPLVTVPPFHIGKLSGGSGGSCDGIHCTVPNSAVLAGAKQDQPYSSVGQTEFCVIPSESLPLASRK